MMFLFCKNLRLEIFFLDPEEDYRLVKTATLAWEMDEISLHRNAMLCDGDRLVMLAQRDVEVIRRTAGELEERVENSAL